MVYDNVTKQKQRFHAMVHDNVNKQKRHVLSIVFSKTHRRLKTTLFLVGQSKGEKKEKKANFRGNPLFRSCV